MCVLCKIPSHSHMRFGRCEEKGYFDSIFHLTFLWFMHDGNAIFPFLNSLAMNWLNCFIHTHTRFILVVTYVRRQFHLPHCKCTYLKLFVCWSATSVLLLLFSLDWLCNNNEQHEKKLSNFELFKILGVCNVCALRPMYIVIPLVVVVVAVVFAFVITISKDDTALEFISCLVGTMLGNKLNESYVR